ncbi:MAG: hypothetical protein KIT58_17390 [Planctomycetota bacterium]|nr:hypothetical protein [Planctomycetota bacterium]
MPPDLTRREARARDFADNGFGDGGHDDRWVKLKAGPLTLCFPNTAARVRAVRFHDLHHVLTGYATTWTGEAETVARRSERSGRRAPVSLTHPRAHWSEAAAKLAQAAPHREAPGRWPRAAGGTSRRGR